MINHKRLLCPLVALVAGVAVLTVGTIDIAFGTGNGGACHMQVVQYDASAEPPNGRDGTSANWQFLSAGCNTGCTTPGVCTPFNTGLTITPPGSTTAYQLWDCGCVYPDGSGGFVLVFDPPGSAGDCLTLALGDPSAAPGSPFVGGACVTTGCPAGKTCELDQIPGTTYGSVLMGTSWHATRGTTCQCK